MLVVDTSAMVAALLARPDLPDLRARLEDEELHSPHLVDVEFLHTLRRLVISERLSEDRAADALQDFADLPLVRYPHTQQSGRMWELRHNLTAYDAAFVALAEALDRPLITCDARLSTASGHRARVEVLRT